MLVEVVLVEVVLVEVVLVEVVLVEVVLVEVVLVEVVLVEVVLGEVVVVGPGVGVGTHAAATITRTVTMDAPHNGARPTERIGTTRLISLSLTTLSPSWHSLSHVRDTSDDGVSGNQAMKAVRTVSAVVVLSGLLASCAATRSAEEAPLEPTARIAWWSPEPDSSWQLQLSGTVDPSVDAEVFDVDGLDTAASTISEIHDRGGHVICYISAGTFEDWRPDADDFPDEVLGNPLPQWPGERWLDIRRLDTLEPILARRMDTCAQKGFDAVDPDNLDGYSNDSGFPLTDGDQLRYNRMVADLAHDRGLGVGLKNDLDQVADLVGDFDFAVNEQCVQYDECSLLDPFVSAGKAVLHVEYQQNPTEFCNSKRGRGFSTIHKQSDLGTWRSTC